MTQEKLYEINCLSNEIKRLKELCQTMDSHIAKYNYEPPTRMSGFDLSYQSEYKITLNEAEVKLVCDMFKIRLKELCDEFEKM